MAIQLPDHLLELDVEEQLFHGVVQGSLVSYEGLLKGVKDVDVRGVRQRTLLHVAVKLGKLDWVEGLLRMGASTEVRDGDNYNVLEVAEEMNAKHPKDKYRQIVLKLVQLVHERDGARRSAVAADKRTSHEHLPIDAELDSELVYPFKEGMVSLNGVLTQHFAKSFSELSSIKEVNSSLSKDMSFLKETMNDMRMGVTSLSREILSGRGTLDVEKKNAAIEQDIILKKLEYRNDSLMFQFLLMKEAMVDAKSELTSRDILLKKLGANVTSLANEWGPLKECVNEVNSKIQQMIREIESLKTTVKESLPNVIQGSVSFNCIEAIMRKTQILEEDVLKVSRVRSLYETIYSTSTLTSCLLSFIQFQPGVKIVVDFDSCSIERMKERVRDNNGVECNSRGYRTFVAFEELTVYVAGKLDGNNKNEVIVGRFAMILAKMSIYLAFKNRGRPYAEGDELNEQLYKSILVEAKNKKENEGVATFDLCINYALCNISQLEKEIEFITVIPQMIAYYGLKEGTSKLCQQAPALLNFYENHVGVTLLNKSKDNFGDTFKIILAAVSNRAPAFSTWKVMPFVSDFNNCPFEILTTLSSHPHPTQLPLCPTLTSGQQHTVENFLEGLAKTT